MYSDERSMEFALLDFHLIIEHENDCLTFYFGGTLRFRGVFSSVPVLFEAFPYHV